jgi:serine/threonine protein kinase
MMQLLTKFSLGRTRKGIPLGERLMAANIITRDQLDTALEHQSRKGYRLGYHLIKIGAIEENTLSHFLAEQTHVPALAPDSIILNPELIRKIQPKILLESEVLPLHQAGKTLTLAMTDPTDGNTIKQLSKLLNCAINPVIAPQSVIRKQLADFFALQEIQKKLGGDKQAVHVTNFFTRLKDFRFDQILGVGGFGMVCKCWQVSLDRWVAVKTMNREMTQMPGMMERFKREGKIIARLHHPSIILVYEQGERNGVLYIVMEFFEGQPLDLYCRGKDLAEKIGCLASLCDALHYAYQQGVVHRDLKPANILANESGEVKLLDFGVAYFDQPEDERLTRQNVILGTPKYMAPECFTGAVEAGTEADIFAMGVIAYELLTDHLCDNPTPKPPHQLNPDIPPILAKTILKALVHDKSKRLKSFDLFKRALLLGRDQLMMGKTTSSNKSSLESNLSKTLVDQAPLHTVTDDAQASPAEEEAMQNAYEEEEILRNDDEVQVIVARHRKMGRRVVKKTILNRHVEPEILNRLSDIKHPNIGQILGLAKTRQNVMIVMEYLEGGTLMEKMLSGRIDAESFAKWAGEMVQALNTARQRGVVHGQLHPGNVLFDDKGVVKIVDFGLSGTRDSQYARFTRPDIRDPYQSDRYALGVIWFEMLGTARFRGASSFEQNFKSLQDDRKVPNLLKVPLARLWGIERYGWKYRDYADMEDDLHFIREKYAPETPTAQGETRPSSSGLGGGVNGSRSGAKPWWAFWR